MAISPFSSLLQDQFCPRPVHAICFRFSISDLPLITFERSPTGMLIGRSTTWNKMANIKYHPAIAATKKQPPVPTRSLAPRTTLPTADWNRNPDTKPKPMVAAMKTITNTTFVRKDTIKKTKLSNPMNVVRNPDQVSF